MIYLSNAATSFPKPEHYFRQALEKYFALGASPGRGGYDAAVSALARVKEVRAQVATFFWGAGVCHQFRPKRHRRPQHP